MTNRLYLSFDAGSSLTKIIYGWIESNGEYAIKYLVMSPECLSLPAGSANFLSDESGINFGRPEDNAWIRYEANGDIFLLGRIAIEYRAKVHLKPLKSKTIVPKILAAVGAIAEKENLGQEIELVLGVLLPFNEIGSKQELNDNLIARLNSFYFRDKNIKIHLNRLRIVPEATGLALSYSINNQHTFKQTNQSFLMLGHRNTSFLVFEKGSFSRSKSSVTNSGCFDFIDMFREKVPGVEREDFLNMLETKVEIERDYMKNFSSLKDKQLIYNLGMLTNKGKNYDFIKNAFEISLNEYWTLISSWLEVTLPSNTDILWICGGGSSWIFHKITHQFSHVKINQPLQEISDLINALSLTRYDQEPGFIKQDLIERMIDVWGLFAVFSNYYSRKGKSY